MSEVQCTEERVTILKGQSAVIFEEDGTIQLVLPNMEDDNVAPEGVIRASMAALLFQCPAAMELVANMMEDVRRG